MRAPWRDKIVWITGGGSGIGRSLALEFAKQGAHLAISGRRADRLEQVAKEIEALGQNALTITCDVTDDDAVLAASEQVIERFKRLDIVIANAGMGVGGPFEKLTDAEWRQQMGVNVFGAASTARHALPHLRQTEGRMVFISSILGLVCVPKAAPYCASKFAVRAMGLTLALELKGSGVSCTTIHPGLVESELGQVDNQGIFHPDRKDNRPQTFMWTSARAAKVIVKAIEQRKLEFVFTGHGKVGAFLGQHFPGVVQQLSGIGGVLKRAKKKSA